MEPFREHLWEDILPRVQKPARYLGTEVNSVHKDLGRVALKTALAFPDLYEVGMSHLGLKILYHLLNARDDVAAERVYAPDTDLEKILREEGLPLFSLESAAPVGSFDLLGFTLQYELSYTTILHMLDLAGIPLRSRDRRPQDPLVVGGGPCAYNPEPVADFFDFFVIGDGEEVILEVADLLIREGWPRRAVSREKILSELAGIPGVYVPGLYRPQYREDGTLSGWEKAPGAPDRVKKRVVRDLDKAYYPTKFVVPFVDIVHDRAMVEVFRGCTRGCRFCQAGMVYRPVRERKEETVKGLAEKILENTGYEEISLTSLSTADYSCLEPVITHLMRTRGPEGVAVSLPSLRLDSFSVELAKKIQEVRKTGLTFAPEAGTQRLRDVINKNVTEEDLLGVAEAAFSAGWGSLKLYFMIGLPTETQEDLDGIMAMGRAVVDKGKEALRRQNRRGTVKVTVSVSSFVPKPHTPFQWEPQDTPQELAEKQEYLKTNLRDRAISLNWHDVRLSRLEGVFSRGDRRLGRVLELAWRHGARFDSWDEHFRQEAWDKAFAEAGVDPSFYAHRARGEEEIFPWDLIDTGLEKEFLWREREKALAAVNTLDCRKAACEQCGVCPGLRVAMRLAGPRSLEGGGA